MPCVLEDAIYRVLKSRDTGAGLSGIFPKWKGTATSQSRSFGALRQWGHSGALQTCL